MASATTKTSKSLLVKPLDCILALSHLLGLHLILHWAVTQQQVQFKKIYNATA